MEDRDRSRERRLQRVGWILFTLCAVLFIVSSARARDPWGLLGSVLFLVACGFFILPIQRRKKNPSAGREPEKKNS